MQIAAAISSLITSRITAAYQASALAATENTQVGANLPSAKFTLLCTPRSLCSVVFSMLTFYLQEE